MHLIYRQIMTEAVYFQSPLMDLTTYPLDEDFVDPSSFWFQAVNDTVVVSKATPWTGHFFFDYTIFSIAGLSNYMKHIETICHAQTGTFINPIDYPLWRKAFDLTLGTFLVGSLEGVTSALLTTACTIVGLVILVFSIIPAVMGSSETAIYLLDLSTECAILTASYLNQMIRSCLKMVPLLGPDLTRIYDIVQAKIVIEYPQFGEVKKWKTWSKTDSSVGATE